AIGHKAPSHQHPEVREFFQFGDARLQNGFRTVGMRPGQNAVESGKRFLRHDDAATLTKRVAKSIGAVPRRLAWVGASRENELRIPGGGCRAATNRAACSGATPQMRHSPKGSSTLAMFPK